MSAPVQYLPGDLTAVVGLATQVLVRSRPDDRLIRALWPLVISDVPLRQVAATLMAHAVPDLPDFALVHRAANGVTALVRGAITVTALDATNRTEDVSAPGVIRWRETVFVHVARVRISVDEI